MDLETNKVFKSVGFIRTCENIHVVCHEKGLHNYTSDSLWKLLITGLNSELILWTCIWKEKTVKCYKLHSFDELKFNKSTGSLLSIFLPGSGKPKMNDY